MIIHNTINTSAINSLSVACLSKSNTCIGRMVKEDHGAPLNIIYAQTGK